MRARSDLDRIESVDEKYLFKIVLLSDRQTMNGVRSTTVGNGYKLLQPITNKTAWVLKQFTVDYGFG